MIAYKTTAITCTNAIWTQLVAENENRTAIIIHGPAGGPQLELAEANLGAATAGRFAHPVAAAGAAGVLQSFLSRENIGGFVKLRLFGRNLVAPTALFQVTEIFDLPDKVVIRDQQQTISRLAAAIERCQDGRQKNHAPLSPRRRRDRFDSLG